MTRRDHAPTRRGALSPARRALLEMRLRGGARTKSDRIPRRGNRGEARLSFAQNRLWFLDQLVPGNPFYNISLAVRLQTAVNHRAMELAFRQLVERHETLRTTFETVEGTARQVIHDVGSLPVLVDDLRHLPEAERQPAALELAAEMAMQSMDFERGPLARGRLVQLDARDWILILVVHHIIADGWSADIVWRELGELYVAAVSGRPAQLPDLPIQYADFAEWQRDRLRGPVLEQELAYWKGKLADLPVLTLPTDHPRPAEKSYRGALCPLSMGADVRDGVTRLAQQEGVTPFMVLMAAVKALLFRYTSQTDLVIGTPIANRNRTEIEGLIGFFVNSLVLRTDLSGEPSFRELVGRVCAGLTEAYSHQDLPFEILVEKLHPERDLGRNPLFQVTFQMLNTPGLPGNASDSPLTALIVDKRTAIFDFALTIFEANGGYEGGIEYATDLFEQSTMRRMATHLDRLLRAALDDPDQPIGDLPILSPQERDEILVAGRGPETEWREDGDRLLHELFEMRAVGAPDATVVEAIDGSLTASELNERANRLAQWLRRRGVGPGELVGVCMERSLDLVVSILAILKAGAAYVPLDPKYPAPRLAAMCREAEIALVLTNGTGPSSPFGGDACVCNLREHGNALDDMPNVPPPCGAALDDPAYVIFTSGSTGTPRGVAVQHRAIVNHMLWMRREFPVTSRDRILQRTAIGFDASVWEFHLPLVTDAVLVLHAAEPQADPATLTAAIAKRRISVLQLVPSMLHLLLEQPGLSACTELRLLFCGGEALPPELAESAHARFGADVVNLYGPTEACIDATFWRVPAGEPLERMLIGRPIANMNAHVLDRQFRPVPHGVPGELWLAGSGIALGYVNQPELTAARFPSDPLGGDTGERAYRTGDQVRRLTTGELEFLGRLDGQVKLRGNRIEIGEVEAHLMACEGVARAAAAVHGESSRGAQLVAYMVPKPELLDSPVGEADLDATLHRNWLDVYQNVVYQALPVDDALDRNFVGWNSSYDGSPIPETEMALWLDETLARILEYEPKNVWEVGCGTGLVLLGLCEHVDQCTGTDFSDAVVEYVRRAAERRGVGERTSVFRQVAGEGRPPVGGPFDTVVLNSVVQYLSSREQLLGVLEQAIGSTASNGRVFLGDVRDLRLLPALQASIEAAAAPPASTVGALMVRLGIRDLREKELNVDPALFARLPRRFGRVAAVEIRPKAAEIDNELVRFRYDVTLHLDRAPRHAALPVEVIDGSEGSTEALIQVVSSRQAGAMLLTGLPNRRAMPAIRLLRALGDSEPSGLVEVLRASSVYKTDEVDPLEIARQAQARGWKWDFVWSEPSHADRLGLLLWQGDDRPIVTTAPGDDRTPEAALCNVPRTGLAAARWVERWRTELPQRLPESMVPTSIFLLKELPLTPNGKLDRRALPGPAAARDLSPGRFVAPSTRLEEMVAEQWSRMLSVRPIGVTDDFFDLGGHSLLAAQLVGRLRDTLRCEIPLRWIFEHPTVEALSCRIERELDPQTTDEDEDLDALLDELTLLSPEERARMLDVEP